VVRKDPSGRNLQYSGRRGKGRPSKSLNEDLLVAVSPIFLAIVRLDA